MPFFSNMQTTVSPAVLCVCPKFRADILHSGKSFHDTYITSHHTGVTPCNWPRHITEQRVRKYERAVLQTGVNGQCGFTRCFHQTFLPKSLCIMCRPCQLTGKLENTFP